MLAKCLLAKCLLDRCQLANFLSPKCLPAQCLPAQCLPVQCLLAQCLLAQCLPAQYLPAQCPPIPVTAGLMIFDQNTCNVKNFVRSDSNANKLTYFNQLKCFFSIKLIEALPKNSYVVKLI